MKANDKTGSIRLNRNGTCLFFDGESYEDSRNIPPGLVVHFDEELDILRAKQAIEDVKTCKTLGMEAVHDPESEPHAFTTDGYIEFLEKFIIELSE